jgi:hypothetical protein
METNDATNRLKAAELMNTACTQYKRNMEADYSVSIDYDGQDDLIIENCGIDTILESRKSWNEKGTVVRHADNVIEFVKFQVAKGQRRDNRLVVELDGVCYWSY